MRAPEKSARENRHLGNKRVLPKEHNSALQNEDRQEKRRLAHTNTHTHTHRHTDTQTYRRTDTQTDRHTHTQIFFLYK